MALPPTYHSMYLSYVNEHFETELWDRGRLIFQQKLMQQIVALRLYPKCKKSFYKPVARLTIGWSFSHIFGIHSNKQLASVSTSCSSLNNLFCDKPTWPPDVLFRVTWSSFSLKASYKRLIRIQSSLAPAFSVFPDNPPVFFDAGLIISINWTHDVRVNGCPNKETVKP